MISLIRFNEQFQGAEAGDHRYLFGYFMIALKRDMNSKFRYGQKEYDFDEGILFFVAPNQVFGLHIEENNHTPSGWMLLVHPDFLWSTPLATKINQYDFWNYTTNEALFLSEDEEQELEQIVKTIEKEYNERIDPFSQNIIVSQLETLLNYSERFYNRMFITRKKGNHHLFEQMEILLADYFSSDSLIRKGLPSVQFVADSLHVSPGYLSNLLKSLTGQTTQQIIHKKLIEKAKEKLSTTDLTVTEVAYELGFEHSQAFSKLFKSKTKLTPLEFRNSFN
ncbi:AraC family transcriptional regulator [Neptunitalea sp. Y10]|uniref:AraC family transcriptional regulator n=2 Tax=Neptunitalea lumnitzerae TaxID=2965509 RepID=A0ABQ5MI95_9FLAO|nr:AraC family transcriptional regulator [Neptunitalea sp. Y10]